MLRFAPRLLLAMLLGRSLAAAEPAANSFERAAAVLARHCVQCHNAERARAGLDLTTSATALRGGDGGPVITPHKPLESLLVERARDGSMPPEDDGRRLTPAEVTALADWIAAGAPWPAGRALRHSTGTQAAAPPSPTARPSSPPLTIPRWRGWRFRRRG